LAAVVFGVSAVLLVLVGVACTVVGALSVACCLRCNTTTGAWGWTAGVDAGVLAAGVVAVGAVVVVLVEGVAGVDGVAAAEVLGDEACVVLPSAATGEPVGASAP
jgi:hypothetical protein